LPADRYCMPEGEYLRQENSDCIQRMAAMHRGTIDELGRRWRGHTLESYPCGLRCTEALPRVSLVILGPSQVRESKLPPLRP